MSLDAILKRKNELINKFGKLFETTIPEDSQDLFELILQGVRAYTKKELSMIPASKGLMMFIEVRLAQFHFLEPTQVNGIWGSSTDEALKSLLAAYGINWSGKIDQVTLLCVIAGEKSAKQISRIMLPGEMRKAQKDLVVALASKQGKWDKSRLNIVGIRGFVEGEGFVENKPDIYNDLLVVIHEAHNVFMTWQASCDPGKYYTQIAPLNRRGAAHLAKGKWLYMLGRHGRTQYPALVQAAPVKVFRTFGKNPTPNDFSEVGFFGINIHAGTYGKSVYNASAGCQVVRSMGPSGEDWLSFYRAVEKFKSQRTFDYFLVDAKDI